ncbi:MAG: hypothetical protein ACRDPY_49425, partial [Streptosporangiaceae bacterium]
ELATLRPDRAKAARFAIFEAGRKIVLVAAIDDIIDGPQEGMHSIVGRVLSSGPQYDRWIGRPSPIDRASRRGVNYFEPDDG